MNNEQLRNIAWTAMNDVTEMTDAPDAISNREFHSFSAATEDDWPTLAYNGMIIDVLPGDHNNEVLVQSTNPETGDCRDKAVAADTRIDMFMGVVKAIHDFF